MKTDVNKGRYWDEGIMLVDGCTPCSPGCDHCWSAARAHRFYREGEPGQELGILTDDKGWFNGDIITHPDRLKRFNTRKPKVFAIWNDLFHEDVPDEFIQLVFNSMPTDILQPCKNTYLVLTKRPKRMADFFSKYTTQGTEPWPNVFLGLTVCNQQEADEKIPIFLQVSGKKFLSIEPMLGPIDLILNVDPLKWGGMTHYNILSGKMFNPITNKTECRKYSDSINAVIVGGALGPGARPMHPDWVRSVRDQCAAAGVPFFFKGWGKHRPELKECFGNEVVSPYSMLAIVVDHLLDGRTHDDLPWRTA